MRQVSKIRTMLLAVVVLTTAIGAGCAAAPQRSTEASTSGIRAAEEVGAHNVPGAALHLQLAKEELQRAKGRTANGDKDRASSLLLRAEVDAELAVTLSKENAQRAEAQAAVERVRQLRQENR